MAASDARKAARDMQAAAREIECRELADPSESYAILGDLVDTQRSIVRIITELADWHRHAVAGQHFEAGHDESTLGIMAAVADLDLAAQQAGGLQEILGRAYGANGVVRWFDSVGGGDDFDSD